MHLATCSQQLPLAPKLKPPAELVPPTTSRSCSTSSKTAVKACSLSNTYGSSVGFPSQCPATQCHQWFHAEKSPTQVCERPSQASVLASLAAPQSCLVSWNALGRLGRQSFPSYLVRPPAEHSREWPAVLLGHHYSPISQWFSKRCA